MFIHITFITFILYVVYWISWLIYVIYTIYIYLFNYFTKNDHQLQFLVLAWFALFLTFNIQVSRTKEILLVYCLAEKTSCALHSKLLGEKYYIAIGRWPRS